MKTEFYEDLIQYEDLFLRCAEQPESPDNIRRLVDYGILYSNALMDDAQATSIESGRRVDQLLKNARIFLSCRLRIQSEHKSCDELIDAIDGAIASIEAFVRKYIESL